MPLHYLESDRPINRIPHPESWRLLEHRLAASDREAIEAALDEVFCNSEIQTAGWIPGTTWASTPWMPIYEVAARRNVEFAGLLFGLLVFEHAMRRRERWIVGRFELNGDAIRSLTYFRADA